MMFRLSTVITDHPAVSHWETSSSLHEWQKGADSFYVLLSFQCKSARWHYHVSAHSYGSHKVISKVQT